MGWSAATTFPVSQRARLQRPRIPAALYTPSAVLQPPSGWPLERGGGGDGDGGALPGSEQKQSSKGHGADVAVPEVDGISISLPAAASQVFQAKLLIAFGNGGVGRKVLCWVFGAGASVPFGDQAWEGSVLRWELGAWGLLLVG